MNEIVAILIPCYNEEATIKQVVLDFKQALPQADIYVYDNNSDDRTSEIAAKAGAKVCQEKLQGKGNVVRRMFADVEADIYIMVDGDDTYDASSAPQLVAELREHQYDMINARRITSIKNAYRVGHRFGNKLLTGLVSFIFGNRFNDMLSGYRVFSRRFVKSFPALATGFEIETELTVHALQLQMPVSEIDTHYKDRPEGSESKLSTIGDGVRILKTIFMLIKQERPLAFFFFFGFLFAIISIGLMIPIFLTFMETGLVPRFPTAILSMGIMLLAFLSFSAGLILDTVTHGRRELKRLHYLQIPAVGAKKR